MSYIRKTIAYLTCNKCSRSTEPAEITYSEWTCSWSGIPLPKGWARTGTEYDQTHLCDTCSQSLPTTMTFGRFNGYLIETLVKEVPSYMLWADRTTEFKLTRDQRDQAKRNKEEYQGTRYESIFDAKHALPSYKYNSVRPWIRDFNYYESDMDLYPDADIPNR